MSGEATNGRFFADHDLRAFAPSATPVNWRGVCDALKALEISHVTIWDEQNGLTLGVVELPKAGSNMATLLVEQTSNSVRGTGNVYKPLLPLVDIQTL